MSKASKWTPMRNGEIDERAITAPLRWKAARVEGGPEPIDDTAPERLRERREALGLSVTQAAAAVTALGYGEWDETSIHYCESPRALLTVRQLDLDRYAAALSAEEARRAKMAAERDAHAVPRLDWLEPASPPAHEVVDVPPEPWHARLVRLAQVAQDTSKACAEAEAAFKVADAERERTRLVRAAAREACHAARKALTAATTARAIIDAQQPASVQAAYDAFRTIATPDTILALITRLRAAEARTAWQPIETLIPLASTPDGYVLAWSPHWGRSDVAWYAHGTWWTAGGRCEDYDMPTHGMPLPEAPHV